MLIKCNTYQGIKGIIEESRRLALAIFVLHTNYTPPFVDQLGRQGVGKHTPHTGVFEKQRENRRRSDTRSSESSRELCRINKG